MYRMNTMLRLRAESAGGFVYNCETEGVYVANESAMFILEFIREGRAGEEIIQHLASRYADESIERTREDVRKFLNVTVASGLVSDVA